MMLFLTKNVSAHLLQMRSADRESAVTLLPCKTVQGQFLVNPARRLALEFAHHIGQAMGRAQSGKNVNMISRSTNRMGRTVEASNHATEILVHPGARSRREPRLAIFRAKDEMIMQREMGRGHAGTSRAPAGAQFCPVGRDRWLRSPGRPSPPANLFRPSGTQLPVNLAASTCQALYQIHRAYHDPTPIETPLLSRPHSYQDQAPIKTKLL